MTGSEPTLGVGDLDAVLRASASFSKTISESDVYLFAGITGDFAPYHVNEQFMKERSYGSRVVHGVLTLGFVSTVSTKFWESVGHCAKGISAGYDKVRFTHPVHIGDTLTASYRVERFEDTTGRFIAIAEVRNQRERVCLTAIHLVKKVDMEQERERSSGS